MRWLRTAVAALFMSVTVGGGTAVAGQDDLFAYRRSAVEVRELSVEHRDGVVVRDITYAGPGAVPVRAYLVEPERRGRYAATLYLHWFEPGNPTQNRTEFLDEAVSMARRGMVALLPDLTFPWQDGPVGDQTDRERVVRQVVQLRRGLDLVNSRPGVDPGRVAVVGHDYGGMYGLLLATAADARRVRAAVAVNVDPTFSNWFAHFFLDLGGDATIRYEKLMEPVDPVRYVARGVGGGLLYQFSEPDFFVPDATRRALVSVTAEPKTYRLYAGAPHELPGEPARAERSTWLAGRLGLS
ncbi:dienelactone hydrolase family protein [Sphaerisporangium aureirubrum]|uniref:Dienelactone hydrolase family protein n=1 Tax=Sphaerisporangium aureirubrum TaxID=1544736 RepID=A0ABW1N9B6_9ACTN